MWLLALGLLLADGGFDVEGKLVPETVAVVHLSSARSPFSASTTSDARGRFRFSHIPAGTYTFGVFTPGRKETQRTFDIGPSGADAKARVSITIQIGDTPASPQERHTVSARELSVPDKARKEYETAEKLLSKNDVQGAISHLERAVEIAPQYAEGWNRLGTIAYRTQRYVEAEKYFRRALDADPGAYAPLVNLGGVLLNLEKFDEALKYNRYAVAEKPADALANSQLGINYFSLGKYDLSEKYLREAVKLDPGHFSNPQLLLAKIAAHKGDLNQAADWLEHFLKQHPDWQDADRMRAQIARWRSIAAK